MWYDSFVDFFGVYSPCVSSSSSILFDGTTTTETFVSTNWGYVLSVLLFSLVLYCLMRMIGGMLKHE